MAPQAVHFKGASVKGKKRKEIEEDLHLDPFVYIDIDLDGIDDKEFPNHQECCSCIRHTPSMTIHDLHETFMNNDPELSSQAELRKLMASDPLRFLDLNGKVVDTMKERKPKGLKEIARELKEQEEMAERSWLVLIKNEE
ncbi:hypothetical protein Q3G72_027978 [Acer saccharum]|nr:hypothetical protein Q3G72_027978 [Acer saccharum]